MVADQKLKKLKPNDEINLEIDADLLLSINKLQDIQDELEKINEKASDEVLEIEKRYNVIRQPVYDKRNASIEAIPEFWATAFLSHPALSELVTDEDHKIFKHLTSIEVEDAKDVKSGYSISFNFGPNPYFEDTKLTKTLTFLDDRPTSVKATSIKWKEGMGISNGVDEEKQGNKRSHMEESFFSWFSEAQQIDDINDVVAEIIKEDLWPNPLIYFNNVQLSTLCSTSDGDEEDSDEDEDEDDNDDEEEKYGEDDDEQDDDDNDDDE